MKLAEALMERAELQKKVAQLKERLSTNARVQEGEEPAEDPEQLLKALDASITALEEMIIRINRTNSATRVDAENTFADLLARRDVLKQKHKAYTTLADAASEGHERYSRSEIKYVSTVNVAELRKQIDAIAKELRRVDTKIQEHNWTTELH